MIYPKNSINVISNTNQWKLINQVLLKDACYILNGQLEQYFMLINIEHLLDLC